MANRYWVGGAGTWNTTSTTNWSASSGGASGASVPTAADSVFFDQAGTYQVTCTGALTCNDITVSAGTVTFANGTTPTFAISGSMSLAAGTVWSTTGAITFNATTTGKTITTNGTTINSAITFNGVGGYWTLGSWLNNSTNTITVSAGTFDTGNYTLRAGGLTSTTSIVRTINLGSSVVYLSLGGLNFNTQINLTFNAGTSTINFEPTSFTWLIQTGVTFYNVAFTSTTAGTKAISGANTFNNLTVTASSTGTAAANVTFAANQTINGTLSTTGTAGNYRVFFASATYGIGYTLTVNSAPSLTDADFRDLYVIGTAAPISGTRIGNRGNCTGITFDTPKTVYASGLGSATQNWGSDVWAASSGGAVSTDNYPLPQDTAVIDNASGTSLSGLQFGGTNAYVPTVDMSARTTAFNFSVASAVVVYGSWTNGSGINFTNTTTLTFSGGNTQTITSAGKTIPCAITVDTYGGTVQLAGALNIGSNTLTVTNGTFNTQGYAVTAGSLSSSNSNVRTISLGASAINLTATSGFACGTTTNLTFNAGTSTINLLPGANYSTFASSGLVFYDVYLGSTGFVTYSGFAGANTFRNITVAAPASTGIVIVPFGANQTINGTLTCAGASAIRRIVLQTSTPGTQRTLTVNSLSADDCDFRDIVISGAASGASPTRAGDCGNNSGITFPAPKTVYWNLAGSQNWSATGWATSSGGTPAANNFPLAQDTAVFDDTGSAGTVTMNAAWNIGTFDAFGRTSAMTLTTSTNSPVVYGNWTFGTGVTMANATGTLIFAKKGTQTITSSGVQFGCHAAVNHPAGTVQLADALSFTGQRVFTVNAGIFDAVSYNVTAYQFQAANANIVAIRMGSGTWTIYGTGVCWNLQGFTSLIAGTSTIVLSDTSTTARTFQGNGLYYNKLTIGGTTGTSTLTITGGNTFGELASTKTVAHTILLPSAVVTYIGKWSVTGTAGNVVTVGPGTAATTYTLFISGPANTGIDYLSVSYCAVSATSPGELYVGANSTNTAGNTGAIIFTATPSPRTLYWVGGTGNWSSTTKWSTSSGGVSGAAIPTSLDSVVFDSASNATAYTATIDAGVTIARCAAFTMAGPASGNVTFAGTVPIAYHGNVSFAATGITRTYTGDMNWAGNASYTFTTNGISISSNVTVNGIGATWTLGSAVTLTGATFTVTYGTFSTSASSYAFGWNSIASNNANVRAINFNASTVTQSSNSFNLSTITNLTFNAGTSQLNITSNLNNGLLTGGIVFNNVSFTGTSNANNTITGANTFNTLSFTGRTTVGIMFVTFNANQTITTLTLNAGTAAAYRTFLASDTIGTPRTLTVTTLTAGAADIDFRDITVTGSAAPLTGTRFGDAKGNSGITFPAAKTVYWRVAAGGNWGGTGSGSWSATSGGALDATMFPLAQDTAVFHPSSFPVTGSTVTINASYNIGTIDMSARAANTMTLSTGITTPQIYGNWINGTGSTLSGTSVITFAGRGSQTITNAGKTFTQPIVVNTPSGSVTLQDSITIDSSNSPNLTLTSGTFDANGYSVTTISVSSGAGFSSANSNIRTLNIGSGTWYLGCSGTAWTTATSTNLTITGTGTISLTNASAKTFAGGGANYSGITLNQGGAGTLTISGNNRFANITNTYGATGATTINLANTTQTVGAFTAAGTAGKLLTITGTSAASPATLVYTGSGSIAGLDYLAPTFVRAYSPTTTWYAGNNSTNGGTLGWIFSYSSPISYVVGGQFFVFF